MSVSGTSNLISSPISKNPEKGTEIVAVMIPDFNGNILYGVIKKTGEDLAVSIEDYSAKSLGKVKKIQTKEKFEKLSDTLPLKIQKELDNLHLEEIQTKLKKSSAKVKPKLDRLIERLKKTIDSLSKKQGGVNQYELDKIERLIAKCNKLKSQKLDKKIKKVAKNIVRFNVYYGEKKFEKNYSEEFKKAYEQYAQIIDDSKKELRNSETTLDTQKTNYFEIKKTLKNPLEDHLDIENSRKDLLKRLTDKKTEGLEKTAKLETNTKEIVKLNKNIQSIQEKKEAIEKAITEFNVLYEEFTTKQKELLDEKHKNIFIQSIVKMTRLEEELTQIKTKIFNFLNNSKNDAKTLNKEILFDKKFTEMLDAQISDDAELNKLFNGVEVEKEAEDLVINKNFLAQINEIIKEKTNITSQNIEALNTNISLLNTLVVKLQDKIDILTEAIDSLEIQNNELNEIEKLFELITNAPAYSTYSKEDQKNELNKLNNASKINKNNQFVNLSIRTSRFLSSLIMSCKGIFTPENFRTSISDKFYILLQIEPNEKVLDAFQNAYSL